jgi:hypothetical protein
MSLAPPWEASTAPVSRTRMRSLGKPVRSASRSAISSAVSCLRVCTTAWCYNGPSRSTWSSKRLNPLRNERTAPSSRS